MRQAAALNPSNMASPCNRSIPTSASSSIYVLKNRQVPGTGGKPEAIKADAKVVVGGSYFFGTNLNG